MELDHDACYRALALRDARFDGRFFTGVTTTGIYCRPVCPAPTPKAENVVFFPTAAAAQEAGFRPCLRCRPETAPDIGAWRGTSNTVSRALSLIELGALDEAGVEVLASRLGVGERQLRRLFRQHLGASPVAVAQTRRILLAQQLLQETALGMTEIAFAAGFGSVRRFNETFRTLFGRPPGALRRISEKTSESTPQGTIALRLRYQPPYDWAAMRAFLSKRAIPGVERVVEEFYSRTVTLDGAQGTMAVEPAHSDASRAILGQQITVAAATTLAGRLVAAHGAPLSEPEGPLTHLFPTARALASADLTPLGLPESRAATLSAVAQAFLNDPHLFDATSDLDQMVRRLCAIRGIGEWTAQYIALRQLREPDAFPATDLGLIRAMAALAGHRPSAAELLGRAEAWRPWRAYAAQHLWSAAFGKGE